MSRRRMALFESWRGLYTDSPRAISEELARTHPHVDQVWVADPSTVLPDGVRRVRRHTPEYFRALVTNDLLVANDIITKHLAKGRHSTYLQAWHGTPLKLIGYDEHLLSYAGADAHLKRLARDVAKWDFLISPSPVCTELWRSAFRYDGAVLEVGYPRNDVLRSADSARLRAQTRETLGLAVDDVAVLYMPTWRDDVRDEQGRLAMPSLLDVADFADAMTLEQQSRTVVLSRMHRNIAVTALSVPAGVGVRVVDVSRHSEVNELYLAADVLVSDYSSAVFDYAVTGKPVLLYVPDLDRYAGQVRGFYFDYEAWAPGPMLLSSAEVGAAVVGLEAVAQRYRERYAAFVAAFCPLEDGVAAARVVAAIADRLG